MIQIIIQIPKKVLFFWRRGAMDDAEAALSLKEGERTCSEFAQQSGCLAVSNRRERQGGTGLEGPEFEQVLQAFIRGQVSVAMMDQYCRQSSTTVALDFLRQESGLITSASSYGHCLFA